MPEYFKELREAIDVNKGYDIEKITKKMIPSELQHKFEVVLNSCNKSLIMKNE